MDQQEPPPTNRIGLGRTGRSKVPPVTGQESFIGMDATVLDFWQWAVSDLQANTTRSMLAEYLVAMAVGSTGSKRVEWDNFDVFSPEGIRIEVKASGYRQSWTQKQNSVPTFGGFRGREWDWDTGSYSGEPKVRADVFVFAVQTSPADDAYDVLDVGQWEFYVIPAGLIDTHAGASVGLGFVRKHHGKGPVAWSQLHEAVIEVHQPASAPTK